MCECNSTIVCDSNSHAMTVPSPYKGEGGYLFFFSDFQMKCCELESPFDLEKNQVSNYFQLFQYLKNILISHEENFKVIYKKLKHHSMF